MGNKVATSTNKEHTPFVETVKTVTAYLEEAIEYFNQENYEKALSLFQYAADQGDAGAQNYLGCMYQRPGVQQDHQQASKWYRKAADKVCRAQTN